MESVQHGKSFAVSHAGSVHHAKKEPEVFEKTARKPVTSLLRGAVEKDDDRPPRHATGERYVPPPQEEVKNDLPSLQEIVSTLRNFLDEVHRAFGRAKRKTREEVWAALNDPEVLQKSIPGAESVNKIADDEFEAAAKAKVGPVSARFKGKVKLTDIDPPNGYTISGEGNGGAAGFAKGSARVTLTEAEGGTLLAYTVNAQVGGKLAQIGQRFIDSPADKIDQ